jgi:glycosyltransferase involved in cell wall biosynthesis
MRKLKICHIVNSLGIGGVERFVIDLCNRLDPDLFEVHIVSLSDETTSVSHFGLDEGVKLWICNYEFSTRYTLLELYNHAFNKAYSRKRSFQLMKIIKEISPDVIHAHVLPRELTLIKLLGKEVNCPLLFTDHLVRFADNMKLHSKILLSIGYRQLYKGVNSVAVSKPVFNYNKKFHIYDPAFLNINIDNGITIPNTLTRAKISDKVKILYIARISHVKGHADLIEAWANIPDRKNLLLQIVGPDEMNGMIQELFKKLIHDNSVEFLGSRNNIPEYLESAHIAVFPSHREGLPLALLEKMSYSLPVIASDIPELSSIITDGYDGLLFKVGDVHELSLQIQKLLASEALRLQLGSNARKTVLEKYNIKKMVKDYETIYNKILKKNKH